MDTGRAFVLSAVSLLLVVTLASGPAIDAVDLTRDRTQDRPPLGSGSATVSAVSLPSGAAIERGTFGAREYYLRIDDAVVRFESVEGRPIVSYKLRVRGLEYTRETATAVPEGTAGRTTVAIEKDTFRPDRIDRPEYAGELLLVLRADGRERELARRNVTVEVVE